MPQMRSLEMGRGAELCILTTPLPTSDSYQLTNPLHECAALPRCDYPAVDICIGVLDCSMLFRRAFFSSVMGRRTASTNHTARCCCGLIVSRSSADGVSRKSFDTGGRSGGCVADWSPPLCHASGLSSPRWGWEGLFSAFFLSFLSSVLVCTKFVRPTTGVEKKRIFHHACCWLSIFLAFLFVVARPHLRIHLRQAARERKREREREKALRGAKLACGI